MAGKAGKRIQDAVRSLERAANPFTKATETPLAAAATSFLTGTPCQRRLYATESQHQAWQPSPTVSLTIHHFPSYEPARLEAWSSRHLNLPLRRDLLHLAVVYEGDNTRQGTASSKTRWDVRGSGRKLYAQKGLGRARVGDAQSPLRRGGGKTFGPHPRDFGTRLNRKVYDLAWRTALSYRYRRGELVVCQDGMELPLPDAFERLLLAGEIKDTELIEGFKGQWARQMLERNEWGKQHGRSTFITASRRDNLFDALDLIPNYGRALDVDEVDVKDLLETGRLVVERDALKEMIERHQSDLASMTWVQGVSIPKAPETGKIVVE